MGMDHLVMKDVKWNIQINGVNTNVSLPLYVFLQAFHIKWSYFTK